ncbi:hypothetical protein FPV67DRAFT_874322 [Lyophyllum atratum]|nr:hypothetical protein FPV67DRAFT_874322 [Lyophyllum atratum]
MRLLVTDGTVAGAGTSFEAASGYHAADSTDPLALTLSSIQIRSEVGQEQSASPIQDLPNEILTHIFIYCVSRKPGRYLYGTPQLPLCRVCSSWRRLASVLPSLWTWLSIDFTNRQGGSVDYYRRLGELSLSYFNKADPGAPLALSLSTTHEFPSLLTRALDGLLPCYDRISELHLKTEVSANLETLFYHIDGLMPLLETIVFEFTGRSKLVHRIEACLSLPSLRQARITTRAGNSDIILIPFYFPHNSLTHLFIDGVHPDDVSLLLYRHTITLQHAAFRFEIPLEPNWRSTAGPPVEYPVFKSLKVTMDGHGIQDIDIFRFCEFPVLETCELICMPMEIPFAFRPAKNLFQQIRGQSLRRLALARLDVDVDELVQYLGSLSTLEELAIILRKDHQTFFDSFQTHIAHQQSLTGVHPLPKLLAFTTDVPAPDVADFQTLSTTIASLIRTWHNDSPSLREVTLYVHSGNTADPSQSFIHEVKGALRDCIYNKETCQTGSLVKIQEVDVGELDISSELRWSDGD